jgi:hypothetical protein
MLKKTDNCSPVTTAVERVVPLDRARTSITLLVVLYHSVINYTYFGIGGDRKTSSTERNQDEPGDHGPTLTMCR